MDLTGSGQVRNKAADLIVRKQGYATEYGGVKKKVDRESISDQL